MLLPLLTVRAQTAFVQDAWWTFQQDCNGDGAYAGLLGGNVARLNWNTDVTNCSGTLIVYEVISSRPCGQGAWTPFHTNSPHPITACRSTDMQTCDVTMSSAGACREYRIEVWRSGSSSPDFVAPPGIDPDLGQHREQMLWDDSCQGDFFGTCIGLSGAWGARADDTSTATREPGEPDHAGQPGGRSFWYCWSASTNLPVTLETSGSNFDTVLAVYTGDSLDALMSVASNDDIAGASDRQSRVTFIPVAGQVYHIAVDGFGGASGILVLQWRQGVGEKADLILWGPAVAPMIIERNFSTNDCEVLEGCAIPGPRRLLGFTTETRNIGVADLVMGNPATNSLFHYAACHGHYHFEDFADFSLLDTNGNLVVAGHKVGFCLEDTQPFAPVGNPQVKFDCNYQGIQKGWADVYRGPYPGFIGLPCQFIDITGLPAAEYVLRMHLNPSGAIPESDTNNNLTLVPVSIPPADCSKKPPNDYFTNSIALVAPCSVMEFNRCATHDDPEPAHVGNGGGHSLWYSWTAPVDQSVVITTGRSDFDTLLAVYTGNAYGQLTAVVSNDNVVPGSDLTSKVQFFAQAGTSYHIAVDGYNNSVGTVMLTIDPPENDDFGSGVVLNGPTGAASGHTTGATKQFGEPAHAADVGGSSVWFTWMAPFTGPVRFSTGPADFNTTLAIYSGSTLTNLDVLAQNNDESPGATSSRAEFIADAGSIYHVAVDGSGGAKGKFTLSWNMLSRLQLEPGSSENFKLTLSGVTWQRYALLASSNLVTWSTQSVHTVTGDALQLFFPTAGTNRYYRSMLMP